MSATVGPDPSDGPPTRVAAGDFVRVETIHADELHPGDIIEYGGQLHRVTRVDRGEGWSWPVACDDDGWAMALGHDLVVLHPQAASPVSDGGSGYMIDQCCMRSPNGCS